MWTSQRSAGEKERYQPWVDSGEVTLSENVTGVYLDGERRELSVTSPGGYHWKPHVGEQVVVLNANQGDKRVHIIGTEAGEGAPDLKAGEVLITSGKGAEMRLTEGDLRFTGAFYLNGAPLYNHIYDIIMDILYPSSED